MEAEQLKRNFNRKSVLTYVCYKFEKSPVDSTDLDLRLHKHTDFVEERDFVEELDFVAEFEAGNTQSDSDILVE